MFKNNKVDICVYGIECGADSSDLIGDNDIRAEVCFGCCYFVFNTLNKPLDDKNVRMALSMAVRRKVLLNLLSKNPDLAAYRLIPVLASDTGSEFSKMFSEDVARARELLTIAGYKDGENFPKLRMVCSDDKICHFLQREWKEALNVDVEINFVDREELLSLRRQGDFDICRGGWFGDYPDPMTFLSVFSTKSQQNYCRWKHDKYDELISNALYSRDDKERSELLKNAEQLLIDNMPIMPLYFESSLYLVKNRVKGWNSNLLDVHLWKFIDVKDD
jgi:oligopeptide transport system substrate-binding protein